MVGNMVTEKCMYEQNRPPWHHQIHTQMHVHANQHTYKYTLP